MGWVNTVYECDECSTIYTEWQEAKDCCYTDLGNW